MMIFSLPWPPSLNTYYRHISRGKLAGRTLLSERGRQYRIDSLAAIYEQNVPTGLYQNRIGITIGACPPDNRKRDLDNLLKSVLDALTHTRVIRDDSDIDDLRIVRGSKVPGGLLTIGLFELGVLQ